MLTEEQRSVFEEIMKSVDGNTGGMFFVYGYGGTGKTFLWKTLSAAPRSKREIVLNVASSGIASLLLTGGRTAHSRFRIPLNLNEDSVCHIKADSDVAKLLRQTKLIIWDEAPMVHKHAFEALNRTMNDIFNFDTSRNSEISFGGKVIVFGGDFRQVLPVVRNGGRQETVNASLSSSYLWSKCKVLTLSRNMRLTVRRSPSEIKEINSFAKWLLDIGEGNVGGPNDGEATIENFRSPNYFSDRAILAPKNEVVNEINDRLLALFPGEEREYLSSDRLCATENVSSIQERLYTLDVLNGLKVSGLPNHKLVLKVGVPVMLLRNIDQKNGLCNGTRLKVTKLYNRVIEAEIISGANIGTRTYIPRISLVPSDKKIPFSFQRRQFPVVVCFAMTINKSQGQSLSRVGLYLRKPVFTHGQLYVALSRVRTRDGVKLLILDKDGKPTNKTTNVVYKEVFNDL
ncbi:ATP-dependent DNA helicase pif1-like [Helianthus annuus]|uniref:ATP-dependent DNA helicase pif1-like n=1 Tax=Helianthus annuus TaxID=4232 RepID=UPI0016532A98|nr:ATP-dependent DNA helicase pif1-like [Helianthus annuus]